MRIERGEFTGVTVENNAMLNSVDDVESHCDAEIVDFEELRFARTGRINCREVAVLVEETVNSPPYIRIETSDPAEIVDRR